MAILIVIKICMIVMVAYVTAALELTQADQEPVAVEHAGTGYLAPKRGQRSVVSGGLQLFMKLVDGAITLSKNGKHITYKKNGNYRTAMKDFDSLKPNHVRRVKLANGKYATEGTVGDYKIFVRKDGIGEPTLLDFIEASDTAKAGKPTHMYTIKYRF